jgi:hypothetical protein
MGTNLLKHARLPVYFPIILLSDDSEGIRYVPQVPTCTTISPKTYTPGPAIRLSVRHIVLPFPLFASKLQN